MNIKPRQFKAACWAGMLIGMGVLNFAIWAWVKVNHNLDVVSTTNPQSGIPALIKTFKIIAFGLCPLVSLCLILVSALSLLQISEKSVRLSDETKS